MAVSQGFLDAWRSGGTRVRQMWVCSSWGATWTQVDFTDYAVAVSRGPNVVARYAGSMTLPPSVDSSLLNEFGGWIQPRAGFVVGGATETVALGTMRIETATTDHRGVTAVEAFSAAARVEAAKFRAPYTVPYGSGIAAITALLSVVPVPVAVETTRDAVIPMSTYSTDQGRWSVAVRDIAQALSVEVAESPLGHFVIRDVPTLDDPVSVRIDRGGVQCGRSQTKTSRGIPSVVVVTGTRVGTDKPPPHGEWQDDNPYSDTYYQGAYGEVVRHVGNPLMTTDQQCALAARTIGGNSRGKRNSITVTSLPMDWLEAGAVIAVDTPTGDVKLIADAFAHRSSGDQSLETRATEDL